MFGLSIPALLLGFILGAWFGPMVRARLSGFTA